jgi:hypothetical protein
VGGHADHSNATKRGAIPQINNRLTRSNATRHNDYAEGIAIANSYNFSDAGTKILLTFIATAEKTWQTSPAGKTRNTNSKTLGQI